MFLITSKLNNAKNVKPNLLIWKPKTSIEKSFGTIGTNCDNKRAVIKHFTIEIINQEGVRLLESSSFSNKKSLTLESL
nr:hypothetical protein [Epilithonimonas hispanica]